MGSFLSFGAALLAVVVRDVIGKAMGGYVINFSLVLTFYLTGCGGYPPPPPKGHRARAMFTQPPPQVCVAVHGGRGAAHGGGAHVLLCAHGARGAGGGA